MNPPILGFLFFIGINYKVMNYFNLPAPVLGMFVILGAAVYVAEAFTPLRSTLVKINVKTKYPAKRLGIVVFATMAVQFIGLLCPAPADNFIELWGMDITLPLITGIVTILLFLNNREDDIFEMALTAVLYGAVVMAVELIAIYYFFAPTRGFFMAVVGAVLYGVLAREMKLNIIARKY